MKDGLKKFVDSQRSGFDDKEPSGRVWTAIESALFGARVVPFWNSIGVWRAAAVVLLGLCLVQFFTGKNLPSATGRVAQQEFVDVEMFYAAQISEKTALISSEGLFEDDSFTQDIRKLEAMYAVLADEMKRRPSDKVKDALVLNMLVRIDLLNQQIQRLEEQKKESKAAV